MPRASLLCLLLSVAAWAAAPEPEQVEFFEKHIRPVLVERCYACHSAKVPQVMGALRVDTKQALLEGGNAGPAIVPGNPERSRLIQALSYDEELKMPPGGKLPDAVLERFREWVRMGAPDPRTAASTPKGRSRRVQRSLGVPGAAQERAPAGGRRFLGAFAGRSFRAGAARRQRPRAVPGSRPADFCFGGSRTTWSACLRRRTRSMRSSPIPPPTLTRRSSIACSTRRASASAGRAIGWTWRATPTRASRRGAFPSLGPTATGSSARSTRTCPTTSSSASSLPRDLLDLDDRRDLAALGFLTVGINLPRPTDVPENLDDRIDVVTRGLLGLSVACARCHDHKFDPIPTRDYYALYGVFLNSKDVIDPVAIERRPHMTSWTASISTSWPCGARRSTTSAASVSSTTRPRRAARRCWRATSRGRLGRPRPQQHQARRRRQGKGPESLFAAPMARLSRQRRRALGRALRRVARVRPRPRRWPRSSPATAAPSRLTTLPRRRCASCSGARMRRPTSRSRTSGGCRTRATRTS